MTRSALLLLAVATLVAPISALASPTRSVPSHGSAAAKQTVPVACSEILDDFIDKLDAPEWRDEVDADAMVLVGSTGYAFSAHSQPGSTGFIDDDSGSANTSGAEIQGTGRVTDFREEKKLKLAFRIYTVDGTTKLRWGFKGKTYTGTVDSCSANIWTATSSNSAIVVKLGDAVEEQGPPT